MTDADLIYNALLRCERKLEEEMQVDAAGVPTARDGRVRSPMAAGALVAIKLLRAEIGNGLAVERR